jgi:intein-encoded DNA endonuclease-like protein
MPICKHVNQNFFKKWTSEMAYVLGFFVADGTMIKNNRGAHFIEFYITDKDILMRMREVLNSNHKVSVRNRKKGWKLGYRLQIGSKEIFNDLTNLGFTQNKSKKLLFPNIPVKYLSHFVRGYFDGDGCIYFKKHKAKDRINPRWVFSSRFTSGSKDFLQTLHSELKKHGLKKGFIVNKKSGYDLVFSHKDSLALYRLMYNNISNQLFLERKYKIFQKAIETLYMGT